MPKELPSIGEFEIQVLRLVCERQPCTERTPPQLTTLSLVREVSWQSWLLTGWAMIVVWQLVGLLRLRLRLDRLLRDAKPGDRELVALLEDLAGQLCLRRVPRIVLTTNGGSPFVCGLRRPYLVLPKNVLSSLDDAQLRQVMLHELAHLKRRDCSGAGYPISPESFTFSIR